VPEVGNRGLVNAIAALFIAAFGIKAAVFPLFFWLPASYHTPPVTVTAIFAALTTKVGVYALIRMFTLVFTGDTGFTHTILLAVALATMITGVLGAAAHDDVRRILAFHIVSQIGYMVLGLALLTPFALTGAVFYLVHHIIVKANLFLIAGMMRRAGGAFDLAVLGGLYRARLGLAVLFLVPALSLAGFPPLSGFWAKLVLLQASLGVGQYPAAAVMLAVGLLTVYSMTKIWTQAFWKPAPPPALAAPAAEGGRTAATPGQMALLAAPSIALAAITLGIGLWPEPLLAIAGRAAAGLAEPAPYVRAVLEGSR
jgi:multicomponent Na+:H+ antiporter subunit D